MSEWLPGKDIPKLLKNVKHNKYPLGIEIGCDYGCTTAYLFSVIDHLRLFCVDPYKAYTDWNGESYDNLMRDERLLKFLKTMEPASSRFILYRETSDDAIVQFTNQSVDFIFVDGIHTYEQVTKDCENYYPFLKDGGLFCGHDYHAVEGVKKAVDEFAKKIYKTVNTANQDIWYWYK